MKSLNDKEWEWGEKNYLMNYNIHQTIINDLKTYPDNIYYNSYCDNNDYNFIPN